MLKPAAEKTPSTNFTTARSRISDLKTIQIISKTLAQFADVIIIFVLFPNRN